MTAKITAYLDRVQALTDAATDDIGIAYDMRGDEWEVTCDRPTMLLLRGARTDMDVMAKVIRAVTEEHRRTAIDAGVVWCAGCGRTVPCPTIRAIEAVIPDE